MATRSRITGCGSKATVTEEISTATLSGRTTTATPGTPSNADRKTSWPNTDPSYPTYNLLANAVSTLFDNCKATYTYEDVWHACFAVVEKLNQQNPSSVFSSIFDQNGFDKDTNLLSDMNGRFCSAGGRRGLSVRLSSIHYDFV